MNYEYLCEDAVKARRQWEDIFIKYQKEKTETVNSYSVKIYFINEGEKKA